ncbi:hypothetical protein D3C72_2228090 [compost metagenome]
MNARQQQLQRLRVAHAYLEEHGALARNGVDLFHLGQFGQPQHLLRDGPVVRIHMHEGEQRPADLRAVQLGGDALDQAVALEPLDAFMHRRGRQVQQLAQFRIAGRRIVRQQR